MNEKIGIECEAQVRQVKTMADHSFNVTINLSEYEDEQAAWFMKRIDAAIKCVAVEDVPVQR
jgi:hypothetical protein